VQIPLLDLKLKLRPAMRVSTGKIGIAAAMVASFFFVIPASAAERNRESPSVRWTNSPFNSFDSGRAR
jgi:hypothetical protein